jgi:lysyl-tRNA synthetase class 2
VSSVINWQPTCGIQQLRLRAQLLAFIRQFFAERDVLEVETPLLCHTTGTDPLLDFFSSDYRFLPQPQTLFLQTSPEFAMKRLLAAGSGSIYQICKAFRNGESGRYHNPEFTMLEWYRIGFNLAQLMDEVAELISTILAPRFPEKTVEKISYRDLFQQATGLNPLFFCLADYQAYALAQNFPEANELCGDDHALWLDFIFSHQIQPNLGKTGVCLVYGYPALLSSLARINSENPMLTDRFEVFVEGIELGNGFFELADSLEQEQRFDQEIIERQTKGLPEVKKDGYLLAALAAGLPDCNGVAVGIDRLLMLLDDSQTIADILAFPVSRA